MVTSEIYTYKNMYEEAGNDLTCANFAHVDGNGTGLVLKMCGTKNNE